MVSRGWRPRSHVEQHTPADSPCIPPSVATLLQSLRMAPLKALTTCAATDGGLLTLPFLLACALSWMAKIVARRS